MSVRQVTDIVVEGSPLQLSTMRSATALGSHCASGGTSGVIRTGAARSSAANAMDKKTSNKIRIGEKKNRIYKALAETRELGRRELIVIRLRGFLSEPEQQNEIFTKLQKQPWPTLRALDCSVKKTFQSEFPTPGSCFFNGITCCCRQTSATSFSAFQPKAVRTAYSADPSVGLSLNR